MDRKINTRPVVLGLSLMVFAALVGAACALPAVQVSANPTPVLLSTIQPGLPATGKSFPTFTAPPPVELTPQPGEATKGITDTFPALTSTTFIDLYRRLDPGVVSIQVNVSNGFQMGQAAGSGFILDDRGHIVTNHHVIANASSVTVVFYDGTQASAQISGVDANSDLAVLQVNGLPKGAVALPLADSTKVQVGEWVMAIGNPFALGTSMSVGVVSAIGREIPSDVTSFTIPDAIQTDAAINPGNSGGPLIDLNGQVIGVNAQIQTNGANVNSGVGFAIASNVVRLVAPALIGHAQYLWPYLGIQGNDIDLALAQANHIKSQAGAYIDAVIPGGPAVAARLHGSSGSASVNGETVPTGGDVIVAVDGEPVQSFVDLLANIDFRNPGDKVQLTILRESQRQIIPLTLGVRPDSQP